MILTGYFEEQIRQSGYSRIMEIRRYVEEGDETFSRTTLQMKADLAKVLALVQKNADTIMSNPGELSSAERKDFDEFSTWAKEERGGEVQGTLSGAAAAEVSERRHDALQEPLVR
jgi:hypothetical protein